MSMLEFCYLSLRRYNPPPPWIPAFVGMTKPSESMAWLK